MCKTNHFMVIDNALKILTQCKYSIFKLNAINVNNKIKYYRICI